MSRAGWYPDPGRTHELRYWDGRTWTDDVADRGVAGREPLAPPSPPTPPRPPLPGGGTVFTEPVLVIDRTFVIDGYDGYSATISDAAVRPLATLTEPRAPSFGGNVMERFASDLNPAQTRPFQVADPNGAVLFGGERPASDLFGQPYVVRDAGGAEIGRLVHRPGPGGLIDMWAPAGLQGCVVTRPALKILDAAGAEVARMTQMPQHSDPWAEIDDRYVIHLTHPIAPPLAPLAIAALLYLEP